MHDWDRGHVELAALIRRLGGPEGRIYEEREATPEQRALNPGHPHKRPGVYFLIFDLPGHYGQPGRFSLKAERRWLGNDLAEAEKTAREPYGEKAKALEEA